MALANQQSPPQNQDTPKHNCNPLIFRETKELQGSGANPKDIQFVSWNINWGLNPADPDHVKWAAKQDPKTKRKGQGFKFHPRSSEQEITDHLNVC